MGNVSKALLIAAAVLVVIILVAVGMKIYSSTSGTQKVATDTGKTISDKTGDAKDLAISEITGKKPINPNVEYYENLGKSNEKKITQDEAKAGDSIKIKEEQFMIFSVTNSEIKAMPYYNITLTTNNPVQTSTAETTSFAIDSYWTKIEGWNSNPIDKDYKCDINMDDDYNKIQKYIDAYHITLKNLGVDVEVRIASLSDLRKNQISDNMRNPTFSGNFWLNSAYNDNTYIWWVNSDGKLGYYHYYNKDSFGVRPIIIISK